MPVITLVPTGEGDFILKCPRCGYSYLHHIGIDWMDRHEDRPTVTKISIRGSSVSKQQLGSAEARNPSARRDGFRVRFECEACSSGEPDDFIELIFNQHKGQTFFRWAFSERSRHEL